MIWLIALSAYLYALLVFSCVFFMEQAGTPYGRRKLIIRSLFIPIIAPLAVVYEALRKLFD